MKCDKCWEEVGKDFSDVVYNHWLKLMNYFEHELLEEEITPKTYEAMVDSLMAVKPWIEDDRLVKRGKK